MPDLAADVPILQSLNPPPSFYPQWDVRGLIDVPTSFATHVPREWYPNKADRFDVPVLQNIFGVFKLIRANALSIPLSFGQPTLPGLFEVKPNALTLALSFGQPTLTTQARIEALALSLALSFGTPVVTKQQFVEPDALSIALSFGQPIVQERQVFRVEMESFALALSFGSPTARIRYYPNFTVTLAEEDVLAAGVDPRAQDQTFTVKGDEPADTVLTVTLTP